MNDLEQSLFCPAWLVAPSQNAANLWYSTKEMTFNFEIHEGEKSVQKKVTVSYPILEGNDSLCFVLMSDGSEGNFAGDGSGIVKLLRGPLRLGKETN